MNKLFFEKIIVDEKNAWFSAHSHNGLYKVNRTSGNIESIYSFPGEERNGIHLYREVFQNENSIIFIPSRARSIAIFDKKSQTIRSILLRCQKFQNLSFQGQDLKFWTAICYKKYIYMFGFHYPAIVRLNFDTGEVSYFTDWLYDEKLNCVGNTTGYFGDGAVRGEYAYLPMLQTNYVMKFNLENASYQLIHVGENDYTVGGLSDDGKNLWITPDRYNGILRWNLDTGEQCILKVPYASPANRMFPFYAPVINKNKVIFCPVGVKDFFYFDYSDGQIHRHDRLSDILIKNNDCQESVYSTMCNIAMPDGLFFIDGRDGSMHLYNEQTGEDTELFINVNENFVNYMDYRLYDGSSIIYENENLNLEGMVAYMSVAR